MVLKTNTALLNRSTGKKKKKLWLVFQMKFKMTVDPKLNYTQ